MKYTISELAERAELSVRNIRAYQSRGLVGSPTMRGRVGYYGGKHLAQLRLITQLQNEGFNLAAIKRVSESTFGADALWLDLTPIAQEALDQRPDSVEMFIANGILQRTPDGTLRGLIAHRHLVWELVDAGLPMDALIDLLELATRASANTAAEYAKFVCSAVESISENADSRLDSREPNQLMAAAVNLMTSFFGTSVGHHAECWASQTSGAE